MTIDLITANPDENDPATIAAEIDLFVQQLKLSIPQFNAAITAFNFNATNSTSTDSLTISTGTKNLNVGAGKSYVKGMAVVCAYSTNPTQWMRGEVLSYDSGTGAFSFDSRYISDTTGTYATWVISQASIESSVEDSEILLTTGNGHGSTDTHCRLLTTTAINTGGAFSVTHSATLGTYITINEPGIYSINAVDTRAAAAALLGVTKNSVDLTSSVAVAANVLASVGRSYPVSASASGSRAHFSAVDRLNSGDILRMHDASNNDGVGTETRFWVRKIGNV